MAKTELNFSVDMSKQELTDLVCEMHNFHEPVEQEEGDIALPPGTDKRHAKEKGKERAVAKPEKVDVKKLREEFTLRILGEIVGHHIDGLKRKQALQTHETKAVTASF